MGATPRRLERERPRAHHPRQEHGAPPGARVRGRASSLTRRKSPPSSCTTWRTCSGWSARTSRSRSRRAPTSSPARRTRPSSAPSAGSSRRAGTRMTRSTTSGRPSSAGRFPGSVSNHHLGTLLGLLMAAYEMNHFKDAYQPAVIANAKAFARALHDAGLDVAGDPAVDYTETHQVDRARRATAKARRSPAGSRTTTSSSTTRRRRMRRASPPPARSAWASPR